MIARIFLSAVAFSFLVSPICAGEGIDPKLTEVWDPQPVVVTPGELTAAPSDAIILFDGTDLTQWRSKPGSEPAWHVSNGIMTVEG